MALKTSGSGHGKKGPRWSMGTVIHGLDQYAKDVPAFNVGGENHITTICGGLTTIFVLCCVLIYSYIKFTHLYSKKNPLINSIEDSNAINGSTMYPMNDIGFRAAFSVIGYLDGEVKDDSKYVKWIVRHRGTKAGVEFETLLDVHLCTEEDYAEFSPIKPSSQVTFDAYKEKLYCLDNWDDSIAIGGRDGASEWQSLEAVIAPCNYIHQRWGYTEDFVAEECIADLDQQKAYLGPLHFAVYVNYQRFD